MIGAENACAVRLAALAAALSNAARRSAQRMIDDANAALAPWQNTAHYMQNLATFAITRNS